MWLLFAFLAAFTALTKAAVPPDTTEQDLSECLKLNLIVNVSFVRAAGPLEKFMFEAEGMEDRSCQAKV